MPTTELTPEIVQVLVVFGVALVLLVTEALRVDVVAALVLLAVAWLGLVTPEQAFSGFSSSAVIAIMAIMVLGHGLERGGVTSLLTRPLIGAARGGGSQRMLAIVMGATALVSAFVLNVGVAALFLPIVVRIAKQTGTPAARLLLPMGYAAILGGVLTMVASSPMILLNGLLEEERLAPYGLFEVAPMGLALVVCCLGTLLLLERRLLPVGSSADLAAREQSAIFRGWDLDQHITELYVPLGSDLIGRSRKDVGMVRNHGLHVLAVRDEEGDIRWAPWQSMPFAAGQRLAVLGDPGEVERFAALHGLGRKSRMLHFPELEGIATAGFAELLVAPRGEVVGKTLRDAAVREALGVEPIAVVSGGIAEEREIFDRELRPGDTLIVHGQWDRIRHVDQSADYTLLTHIDVAATDPGKAVPAGLAFVGSLAMALAGLPIATSMFTGAVAMVLGGVLRIDDAYRAISWRTVFLLAGLIPLGMAFKETGAAAWVAEHMMTVIGDAPQVVVLLAIGLLTTLLSLFSSNVAATLMLVPLCVDVARRSGIDPRPVALLVVMCTANSFLLPTNQVNALLMGPGGYHNRDYLRAGSLVTVIFLAVAVACVQLMLHLG